MATAAERRVPSSATVWRRKQPLNHLERQSEWLLFLDWKIPLYKVETVVRVVEAKV